MPIRGLAKFSQFRVSDVEMSLTWKVFTTQYVENKAWSRDYRQEIMEPRSATFVDENKERKKKTRNSRLIDFIEVK